MVRRKKSSWFIPFVIVYAALVVVVSVFFANQFAEGSLALLLFGFVPVVMFAWLRDALVDGEMWRRNSRTLSDSATGNIRRITRAEHPRQFWLMAVLTAFFALAIIVFVIIGFYVRITLAME